MDSNENGSALPEGATCKPNISARGRRFRQRFGIIMLVTAATATAYVTWAHVYWPFRALVFFPMTMAGFGLFQASRNTCVARAKEGMFEHDDMSKTAAPDDEVRASRKVAAGIQRDAALLGLAGAAVAVATMFIG